MGLRVDLVHKLTPELLLKSALANQHRYKPEPLLATTGVGSLTPTTKGDIARDRKVRKSINRAVLKAGSARKP
jgi:hypothetical protein